MKKRITDLNNGEIYSNNLKEWLQYYNKKQSNWLFSFAAINIDQNYFESVNYDENIIINFINHTYDSLENYRHIAIIISGEIYNKKEECITWKLLYKSGIYAENFIQFSEKFLPFHKDRQIKDLTKFLNMKEIKNSQDIASEFYENISTGFKYEDCYISNDQKYKILLYKKIQLDNTNVPCPSCNTIIQSGNSYPEMFLKSWECKNPSCSDRSKSGRGKRFDEYGTYRYFKLVEHDSENVIDSELYKKFRRDIFNSEDNFSDLLIKEYTFSGEKILFENLQPDNLYKRNSISLEFSSLAKANNSIYYFEELPIVKFFNKILRNKIFNTGNLILNKNIEIINDDSSLFIQTLKPGQIGAAITSPPYYNAREYSQWKTLLMYFVDMIINCKSVYNTLANNSYYLYNIGDIVCEDNIYVKSNMSKRRIQLGFLSSMIFELAGFSLSGNIIWDKGEVQSKRNSTINLSSGYVKCVNCYEHILVFRKGNYEPFINSVVKINPVIKINNKGENKFKHTAPYPLELVDLISPYINKNLYLLDPFLGSGTSLIWCKNKNYNGVGIELNNEYYNLCLDNINKKQI